MRLARVFFFFFFLFSKNNKFSQVYFFFVFFFFFFLTTVKTRRASLNNLSSSQLRTAIGRSLLADRLTGYPAGPCARIPQASWSTTPAVGGYLIPRESAVPKSG